MTIEFHNYGQIDLDTIFVTFRKKGPDGPKWTIYDASDKNKKYLHQTFTDYVLRQKSKDEN